MGDHEGVHRGAVEGSDVDLPAMVWRCLIDWLATLFSALSVAVLVYRLTKGLGFVDPSRRAVMLPFNLAPPTNTLYQYMTCLATVIGVGAIYAWLVLRRLGRVARGLDLLAATVALLLVWYTDLTMVAIAALGARAIAAVVLVQPRIRSEVERHDPLVRAAAWSPLAALVVFGGLLALLLPAGISTAVATAPPWLLAVIAAPFVLFAVEHWLSPAALRWERRIGLVLGLAAIPLATFRVAAPYFDFATIVGPVNDVLLGKDILDSVVSTYGFLFIYVLAAVFRIFHVKDLFIGLAVVNAIAYTLGYAAIFGFLFHQLRRFSLCLASLMAVVAIHYFHLHVPIAWLPQSGFLRFGGMLPVFLGLYVLEDRPRSGTFEWIFAGYCAIALFWTLEVGGYIALGLGAALGRDLLFGPRSDRRALRLIGKIVLSVVILIVLVTVWIRVRHAHWPLWRDLLHFQRAYSAGLAMGRMTTLERWAILVLIYLGALFASLSVPRTTRHGSTWIFLAVFGLCAMVYPLGKAPGIFELARVSLPAILLVAVFVGFLYDNRGRLVVGEGERRANLGTIASVGLLCLWAVAICFVHHEVASYLVTAMKYETTQEKPVPHAAPSWQVFLKNAAHRAQFQRDLEAIQSIVPAGQALPILSKNDTLYYVFSERKALFKNSFYPHFFFRSDLDDIVNVLLSSPVEYLFIDNSQFQPYENTVDKQIMHDVWVQLSPRYHFLRHAGLLDLYQRLPAPGK